MKENTLLTKRKSKIQEKKDQENKISTVLSTQSTKKKKSFKILIFSFINSHLWGLRFSLLSLFETTEKTKTYADKEGQAMYSRSA